MKRHHVAFFAVVLIAISFFSSCQKEDVIAEPAYFKFQFSSFEVTNGDYLTIVPTVDTEKSCQGLEIHSVQYFWDDNLIDSQMSYPFSLHQLIENQTEGNHVVKIKISYGGKGYLETHTQEGFEFVVRVSNPSNIVTSPSFSPGKEIANGEMFRCEAKLDEEKTTAKVKLSKVRFAWDDKLLSEVTESPFVLEHVFENESLGEHILTIRYFISGEIEAEKAFDYRITITE